MECQTIAHYVDNEPILKDKKKYNTFWDAFNDACKINHNEKQLYEMVAYKCKECEKFHIGTSDKPIARK